MLGEAHDCLGTGEAELGRAHVHGAQRSTTFTSSRALLARGLSLSWLLRLVTYVRWCFPQCTSRVSCRNNLETSPLIEIHGPLPALAVMSDPNGRIKDGKHTYLGDFWLESILHR